MVPNPFKRFFGQLNNKKVICKIQTKPNVYLKCPKIVIPREVKMDFQREFRQMMGEEKRGVVRKKRYGPF